MRSAWQRILQRSACLPRWRRSAWTRDGATLNAHMLHDKKMDAGNLPFLLMRGIGQTFLAKDVDLADVSAFLDAELVRG